MWYALGAVSMDVPDAMQVKRWIGVDRGQNNIAVAALPLMFGKFWQGGRVKGLRRQFQRTRARLQESKQLKEVKRLEQRARRIMTHINHVISKQLVQFAKDFEMGLRFEMRDFGGNYSSQNSLAIVASLSSKPYLPACYLYLKDTKLRF